MNLQDNRMEGEVHQAFLEPLSALEEARLLNEQLKQENARLKLLIEAKNSQITELEEELQTDSRRIDYLFEIVATQEQERRALLASLKGDAPIVANIARAINCK